MLKHVTAGAALIISIFAGNPSLADASFAAEVCPKQGKIAGYIMSARQYGTFMSEKLAEYPEDTPLQATVRNIIYVAYDEPIWSSERRKEQAIHEFRDMVEVQCFRALG